MASPIIFEDLSKRGNEDLMSFVAGELQSINDSFLGEKNTAEIRQHIQVRVQQLLDLLDAKLPVPIGMKAIIETDGRRPDVIGFSIVDRYGHIVTINFDEKRIYVSKERREGYA